MGEISSNVRAVAEPFVRCSRCGSVAQSPDSSWNGKPRDDGDDQGKGGQHDDRPQRDPDCEWHAPISLHVQSCSRQRHGSLEFNSTFGCLPLALAAMIAFLLFCILLCLCPPLRKAVGLLFWLVVILLVWHWPSAA